MPARRARSCWPPTRSGSRRRPRRTTSAPTPGWSAELVGADRDEVGVEASPGRAARCPAGGRRVDVDQHAGRPGQLDDLGHRLDRADLVVGPLAVHQGRRVVGVPAEGVGHRVGVDPAVGRRPASFSTVASRRRGVADGRVLDRRRRGRRRSGRARQAPQTAALIASVPPEVKTTWRGRTPSRAADLLPGLLDGHPHGRTPPRGPGRGRRTAGPARPAAPRRPRAGAADVEAWSR